MQRDGYGSARLGHSRSLADRIPQRERQCWRLLEVRKRPRQYHRFFGAHIGWKWDAAIMQAKRSGWKPHSRTLYDWGCGSGIATLRMIEAIGIESVDEVILWDHSTLATAFASNTQP